MSSTVTLREGKLNLRQRNRVTEGHACPSSADSSPVAHGVGGLHGTKWFLLAGASTLHGWQETKMVEKNLASALRGVVLRGPRHSTVVSALALAAALNWAATAQAGNTYVVSTALDPTGPANSLSLREAITAANIADGNTIQFDPALAGSTITLATGEIQISHSMNIVGPGAGKLAISGGDASRIFYLSCANTTQHVSISGLTLRNGSTTGYGGAISSKRCYLDLSGANISASHAKGGGGVSFNNGRIAHTVVSTCNADAGGGGVLEVMGEGPQSIEYSTISSNHAGGFGGGVAILFTGSSVIRRSTIDNNFVPPPQTAVTGLGGGAIAVTNAGLKLYFSTITNNHSYKAGGGISIADSGAADAAMVYRSTITSNYSNMTEGNGLYAHAGRPTVTASIIADNFNKYGGTDLSGYFLLLHSLVQNPGSATIVGMGSIFGVDAHLGELAVNGGVTQTRLPFAASLAVDGFPGCGPNPGVDQRGVASCVNGKMDIGAVERQSPEVIIFRDGFDSG